MLTKKRVKKHVSHGDNQIKDLELIFRVRTSNIAINYFFL